MSVPPVVALPRRMSPKPMPQNSPPYTVASHMSCTGKCRDAPSSSREKAMVAISERMPKRSPTAVNTALTDLGKIATPLALFTLGASFRLDALRSNGRTIAWVTAGKLVIVPLAVLSIAIALGYREQALASVLIAFGGPVAVSSFTMAQQMDGDSDLAAELVISTTLFSVLTLFVFIFIFKMLGLV